MTTRVRCRHCKGIGIIWNQPIAELAVVKAYPTLHGFDLATRLDPTHPEYEPTTQFYCNRCRGRGFRNLTTEQMREDVLARRKERAPA